MLITIISWIITFLILIAIGSLIMKFKNKNDFLWFFIKFHGYIYWIFFSVIILSFFLKLMLYKNQIDNLNNAIKREILYDDINNLFKRFSNTKNLAKRKAIKNKQKNLLKIE